MHIRWHEIDHRLRGVDGLDDVLSIDLNFLCRQMQPPVERQYRRRFLCNPNYVCGRTTKAHLQAVTDLTADTSTVGALQAMDVG